MRGLWPTAADRRERRNERRAGPSCSRATPVAVVGVEFRAAHRARYHGDAKTHHDAGEDARTGISADAAGNVDGNDAVALSEGPTGLAKCARTDDAIVRREIGGRLGDPASLEVGGGGDQQPLERT